MTWDLPTDCLGNPEAVAGYFVLLTVLMVSGWYDCGDGSMCPVYSTSPQMQIGFVTEREWTDMPTPDDYGIDVYEVVAVDEAGNVSEDCPDP